MPNDTIASMVHKPSDVLSEDASDLMRTNTATDDNPNCMLTAVSHESLSKDVNDMRDAAVIPPIGDHVETFGDLRARCLQALSPRFKMSASP